MAPTDQEMVDALAASSENFQALVGQLTPEQLTARAYPADWSIAQVASHLGSGAEIFGMFFANGIEGTGGLPGIEMMQPIWAVWDARSPKDQAHESMTADSALLQKLQALPDSDRAAFNAEFFGGRQLDFADFVALRLGEHALHTWDIEVALSGAATALLPATVPCLFAQVGWVAQTTGKSIGKPVTVHVTTTEPTAEFTVAFGDAVTWEQGHTGDPNGQVSMPAEALIRLVYGRLDPDHTPESIQAEGIELDELRAAFPGF